MGLIASVSVSVEKSFICAPEQVFDAWITPALIREWFAPDLGPLLRVEVDPRVGGAFSIVQVREGAEVDHWGSYLRLDRARGLTFTWGIAPEPAASIVSVDCEMTDHGCLVTLTHEIPLQWADFAEQTRSGWLTLLTLMAKCVESDDSG